MAFHLCSSQWKKSHVCYSQPEHQFHSCLACGLWIEKCWSEYVSNQRKWNLQCPLWADSISVWCLMIFQVWGANKAQKANNRINNTYLVNFLGLQNKIPQAGWFRQQKFVSHSPRGWKFKIPVSAGLAAPESNSLGLQVAAFLLCPHVAFPLHPWCPSVCSVSSSHEDNSQIRIGVYLKDLILT